MGFGVGVTTLKLANKISSKARGSRTGKLRGVACEALKERWGKDPDIDRSLTPTNVYQGEFDSGVALTEQLTKEAQEYSEARKAAGGRGLREDASIGYSVILKPDKEAIEAMTPEQRDRFFKDGQEILDGIFQSRCRARVRHRDEPDKLTGLVSEHEHSIYDGFCPDGRLCVNDLVNPAVWKRINTEFPKKMREKGWEVDDCELYDEKRAETDPAYKAEREAKRKDRGLTAGQYKRKARKAAQDAREMEQDIRQVDLDAQADLDAAIAAQAEYDREAKQEILDAQAVQQQEKEARYARTLQRIQTEQQQLNEGRRQVQAQQQAVEADRRNVEAREAILTGKYAEISRAATEAVTAALRRIPEDKRETPVAQANARSAGQLAAEREATIQRLKAQAAAQAEAVKQPGQRDSQMEGP